MGVDPADDHVRAAGAHVLGSLEHRVGLADAGGRAEEDLELAWSRATLLTLETLD